MDEAPDVRSDPGNACRSLRPPSEEERLVEAAQRGDRAAFGELYVRFGRMVHGILLARVPHHEVEDLVQEVFVKALKNLGKLEHAAAFGSWLATIARHRACDRHRRGHPTEALPPDVPGAIHPEDHGHAVLAAIRALPEVYREPLILRLVEGMTGPEIAERTGLSHGSVRVNLHRGMAQLRARLKGGEHRER
jgi:RNA polymerase sigma-70 factor, ECF subfamily